MISAAALSVVDQAFRQDTALAICLGQREYDKTTTSPEEQKRRNALQNRHFSTRSIRPTSDGGEAARRGYVETGMGV